MKLVQVIAALFLPPLGVFLKEGIGEQFLINLVLLFVIPYLGGLLHALYIVLRD